MNNNNNTFQNPVPTPLYILRGHVSPIHALHLFSHNLRLVSADANGWVVVWDMVSKRAVAVWKAHDGAVLELKGFWYSCGVTEIYTHGRDHKLRVWKFTIRDEEVLDKILPVDQSQSQSQTQMQPWLLHSLSVNALNFCAFSMVFLDMDRDSSEPEPESTDQGRRRRRNQPQSRPVLFTVPNALNSGAIDLFHLPLEKRIYTIPAPHEQTGMVMAVNVFFSSPSGVGALYVCCAYEDGHVMVFACRLHASIQETIGNSNYPPWKWERLYSNHTHSQPVLGIDISPTKEWFLSSSADALLGKHPIPSLPFPFSRDSISGTRDERSESPHHPLKIVNTKHAGQQGVRVRSDGRIFATAGWDARVRVYSCKSMKELAVLKWHKEGCFVVGFAEVLSEKIPSDGSGWERGIGVDVDNNNNKNDSDDHRDGADMHISHQKASLAAVQQQRYHKVQRMHWLVAGSKDGKISLWDIY